MKKLSLLILCLYHVIIGYAQFDSGDFKTIAINKKVKEFPLQVNLSTPLDSYLSREYVMYSGKQRLWYEISTYEFAKYFNPQALDKEVSKERQEAILNEEIKEIVLYKDSVAAVLTYDAVASAYFVSYSRIEDGKWVNTGQNKYDTAEEHYQKLSSILKSFYSKIPIVDWLKNIPQKIEPFVDYIRKEGQTPEDFVLTSLGGHKIVIYGEYHRRKVSWDMLKRMIRDKRFVKTTGTIFMELPSRMQSVMDRFFAQKTMDTELLLQIFREEQPHGWWDKDEYEFLMEVWKLNKSLKPSQRIKVVLADFQIPYSTLKTREEFDNCPDKDRNLHMADVVENHVKNSKDKRNHLFIVGCGHAYKSNVPGKNSTPDGHKQELTAGAQLAQRFSDQDVFTIFQHVITSDNSGNYMKLIRGGAFDRAFEEAGNKPVAFKLKGSPFGAEPFDGLGENFSEDAGLYQDNFDGYVFLHPLKDEASGQILDELFTDQFVEEMKRRAVCLGNSERSSFWFGRKAKDLTPEYIIDVLQNEIKDGKKYPEELFK